MDFFQHSTCLNFILPLDPPLGKALNILASKGCQCPPKTWIITMPGSVQYVVTFILDMSAELKQEEGLCAMRPHRPSRLYSNSQSLLSRSSIVKSSPSWGFRVNHFYTPQALQGDIIWWILASNAQGQDCVKFTKFRTTNKMEKCRIFIISSINKKLHNIQRILLILLRSWCWNQTDFNAFSV